MIIGKVQGVFFRSSLRNQARLKDVMGWVRNTRDRGVEALFEGEKERIEEVLAWCREGPVGAEVAEVTVSWGEFSGNFDRFEIR